MKGGLASILAHQRRQGLRGRRQRGHLARRLQPRLLLLAVGLHQLLPQPLIGRLLLLRLLASLLARLALRLRLLLPRQAIVQCHRR